MDEREHLRIQENRKKRGPVRLAVLLGVAVWTLAMAGWIIEADEAVVTIGLGRAPAVATDGEDDTLVAWENSDLEIVIQTLRMGVTVGTPFQASSTGNAQRKAAAAHLAENEFVVAWEEEDGAGTGVVARRILIDDAFVPGMGVTVGTPIQLAATGGSPAVDADEDGDFAVAWTGPDPHLHFLNRHYVALVSRMGVTVGTPIQLGSLSGATPPDLARRPDGDMLVVWEDAFKDIRGAVVDADGDVVSDGVRINQLRLGRQSSPAVTVPLDGIYLVVWERKVIGLRFVVGRRVGLDGHGLGGEFLVSPSLSTVPTEPDVGADPWGRVLVTWTSKLGHHGPSSILGREYDLFAGVVGDEIVVVPNYGVTSAVDRSAADDDFIVVWESETGDGVTDPHVISGRHVQLPY